MVVEEIQLLQRCEHAKFWWNLGQVIAGQVQELQMTKLGNLGRYPCEGVVIQVEVDKEGEGE